MISLSRESTIEYTHAIHYSVHKVCKKCAHSGITSYSKTKNASCKPPISLVVKFLLYKIACLIKKNGKNCVLK